MRHSTNLKSIKQVEALDAQKEGRVTMKKNKPFLFKKLALAREAADAATLQESLDAATMKLIKNVGKVP